MKKMWLLGSVALVAFASPAFAQQATGLYVSAGVGANWLDGTDWELDGTGLEGDVDYDVGPMGVVAVGYDWGYLRTEAELGFRTNDFSSSSIEGNDLDEVIDGHTRTISVMANALVDFDLGPVTIYGGGGLGLANIHQNINFAGFADIDDTQSLLAWQGIAGLAYNISPQLAVTAEYRYFSTFDKLDTFEIADDTYLIEDQEFVNQSALIGIRYTFAPPAAAAIVAVTEKSYLVFFDFDSSQLTPDAQSIVATAAADALAGGSPSLNVTGHTDRSGSDAYNQALSIRRATSVQNALIAGGVPADIIVIRGAGEAEPLVPTADGVREPQNRRVEIVLN